MTTISGKVEHVLAAPNTRDHHCHWPGCTEKVAPARWGCREHWYTLPKPLRYKIWRAYHVGQEVTKTPSAEYIAVAKEAQAWIAHHLAQRRPGPAQGLLL